MVRLYQAGSTSDRHRPVSDVRVCVVSVTLLTDRTVQCIGVDHTRRLRRETYASILCTHQAKFDTEVSR